MLSAWSPVRSIPLRAWKHSRHRTTVTSLILLLAYVMKTCQVCATDQACPVTSDFTDLCHCTPMRDIRCRGLQEIPKFVPDGHAYSSIYLDRQAITKIPHRAFANLSVASIVLNFNPLDAEGGLTSTSFKGLGDVLQQLQLGDCGIRTLPDTLLANMHDLRRLHLWANQIFQIPVGFFKEAQRLEELVLWGNQIEELNGDTLAGLWNLRRLDLDRNRIATLSQVSFRHLYELRVLHLGENRIKALHGVTFSHMPRLRVLNLDNNGLRYVYSKAFDGLDALTSLGLQDNNIDFIPDEVFAKLHNLTALWLQNNTIEYVWTSTFTGLHALRQLRLGNNRLSSLPDGVFRQSASLRELSVENNRLQTLRRCVLHRKGGRERLRALSLYGNPIGCDCRLTAWVREMEESEDRTVVWGACRVGAGFNESVTSWRDYDGGDVVSQSLFRTVAGCNATDGSECLLRS